MSTYYQDDISSHLFGPVVRKTHPDVAGVLPGLAMPIPYTNSCGTPCHNVSNLDSSEGLDIINTGSGPAGTRTEHGRRARKPGSGRGRSSQEK